MGANISISCNLTSNATEQWLWRKAEPCNVTMNDCYMILANKTLQLIPVEFGDEGEYQCRGKATNVSANITIVGEYSSLSIYILVQPSLWMLLLERQ